MVLELSVISRTGVFRVAPDVFDRQQSTGRSSQVAESGQSSRVAPGSRQRARQDPREILQQTPFDAEIRRQRC